VRDTDRVVAALERASEKHGGLVSPEELEHLLRRPGHADGRTRCRPRRWRRAVDRRDWRVNAAGRVYPAAAGPDAVAGLRLGRSGSAVS
jgi:hypothetical protein